MPVRSLNSSVFTWPDLNTVHQAAKEWADKQVQRRDDILRIGYIGSYARRDWGVGSDLDLILLLENSSIPFWRRSQDWDLSGIPVPTDVMVYTRQEWERMAARNERFFQTVTQEAVWIYERL